MLILFLRLAIWVALAIIILITALYIAYKINHKTYTKTGLEIDLWNKHHQKKK